MTRPAAVSVDALFDLYEHWGAEHYDEELSQLDHALQTAAQAVQDSADDVLVAAALLHDVGHLLVLEDERSAGTCPTSLTGPADPGGIDQRHELIGAHHLAGLFGPAVTRPVAMHVRAKRYRCAVDPDYRRHLSPASTRSLERQGGPLTAAEARFFAVRPGAEAAVRLRAWDDGGKVQRLHVAPFEHYRPFLERLATG